MSHVNMYTESFILRLYLLAVLTSLGTITQAATSTGKYSCQEEVKVELLQKQVTVLSPAHTHTLSVLGHPSNYLKSPAESHPVYWMHIPKCNSGFMRSVLLMPGLCRGMSPGIEAVLSEPSFMDLKPQKLFAMEMGADTEDFCQGGVADLRHYGMKFGDHSGIGLVYEAHVRKHGMIILRQPEQRLISGYNDNQHSWPTYLYGRLANNISEYADVVGGCTTKMLTRAQASDGDENEAPSACGSPTPPTSEESALAVSRLKEGFIFVGIVEQYELSVCLFHQMFGGQCAGLEIEKADAANASSSSLYDTTILNGWVDDADRPVYSMGKRIFEDHLKLYRLNWAACQPCWDQAEDWWTQSEREFNQRKDELNRYRGLS